MQKPDCTFYHTKPGSKSFTVKLMRYQIILKSDRRKIVTTFVSLNLIRNSEEIKIGSNNTKCKK